MAYEPLYLLDGDNLTSDHIRHIEEGILQVQEDAETMKESLVKILGDKDIAASTDESMSDIVKKFTYLKNPDVKEYEYSEDIIDIRKTVESGTIQMVVIDSATTGFYIGSTNGFSVDWGDGKTNSYGAGTILVEHTYTKGTGSYYDGTNTQYVITIYPENDGKITYFRSVTTSNVNVKATTALAFAAKDVYFSTDSLNYTFAQMNKLKYIDIFGGSFGTSDLNMGMNFFACNCSSLERISGNVCWNSITEMSLAFRDCSNLTTIDLGDTWDTRNCTMFNSAFYNCRLISEIPIIMMNSAINISSMFNSCSSLITINGDSWNLTNCNNMTSTFSGCISLTTIPLLLNTENVNLINECFGSCKSLVKLHNDQLTLDFSSVKEAVRMFSNCVSLKELPVMDLSSVTNVSNMFYGCSNLYIIQEVFNLPNVVGSITPKYYYSETNLNNQGLEFMFYGCSSLTNAPEIYAPNVVTCRGLFYGCLNLVNVPTAYSFPECLSAALMFSGCSSLQTAPQILHLPKTLALNNLFRDCINLKVAPSPNDGDTFEFPEAIQAPYLFSGCSSLQTAPVELKLPKATNVSYLFSGCSSLQTAPKTMEFGAATSIESMFSGCSSLQIPPNRISAPKAITAKGLFRECSSLIVCPELDLPLCTNLEQCFYHCKALTSTIPYHFPKATNIQYFYQDCNSLTFIEEIVSDATTLNAGYFATYCPGLISVAAPVCTNGHLNWANIHDGLLWRCDQSNAMKNITNAIDVFSCNYYLTDKILSSEYLEGTLTLSGLKNTFTLNNKPYLTGFRLENPQTNMANITITNCALDADALNQLFEDLPKVTSTRTITIKGNPGAETCDRSIANAKNWTVVYI